jgi:hypothetical protein
MSRTYWSIYVLGSGNTWVFDNYIPKNNTDFNESYISNTAKLALADGSSVFFTPEYKKKQSAIVFDWIYLDRSFYDMILGYIDADEIVKIETDINGLVYTGKFISASISRMVGIDLEDDVNMISASFEPSQ